MGVPLGLPGGRNILVEDLNKNKRSDLWTRNYLWRSFPELAQLLTPD